MTLLGVTGHSRALTRVLYFLLSLRETRKRPRTPPLAAPRSWMVLRPEKTAFRHAADTPAYHRGTAVMSIADDTAPTPAQSEEVAPAEVQSQDEIAILTWILQTFDDPDDPEG